MQRRNALASAAAALLTLSLAGAALSVTSAVSFELVSDYDLSQLGFEFESVGLLAAAAELPEEAAVSRAVEALGAAGTPEVKRLRARILPDDPKQSVWVVVFAGGDSIDVPWGPYSEDARPLKAPSYSGFLIDDRTGEILVSFRGGHQ